MVKISHEMSRVQRKLHEAKTQGIDPCVKLEEIVSECERMLARVPRSADALADRSEAQMLLSFFCEPRGTQ